MTIAHPFASNDFSTMDDDALAAAVSILAAHIHAATYRLLVLIAELDRREVWAAQGGVPPKLIIFNGFLVGAGAQHCQGQIRQRDRFATTMTIPTRNGDFGVTRAGSEWPARRAHSTACPNA